jgi:hypothetical protein
MIHSLSNKEGNMSKVAKERHWEKHYRKKLWSLEEMMVEH